jgi:hypothetical protein
VQLAIGAAQIPDASQDQTTTERDVSADGSCQRSKTCPSCGQGRLVLSNTLPRQPRPPP